MMKSLPITNDEASTSGPTGEAACGEEEDCGTGAASVAAVLCTTALVMNTPAAPARQYGIRHEHASNTCAIVRHSS